MADPIADRVVLVTGASGGLGRVAARVFAAAGARVVLAGTDRDRLVALAGDLALADGRWLAVGADLRRPDDARRLADEVGLRFGSVDVLLHLVGGYAGGTPLVELDRAELEGMLDQHLRTTFNVILAVVPGMVARGWGRVIAVSSTSALEPGPRMAAYTVAKAAEETLLKSLAKEVAATGVTANVIAVRAIDVDHERERSPSPRNSAWSSPEEVVAAMRYLCSAEGAAANGIRLSLDGRR